MTELWQNVTDIIVQPSETFNRLRERPMVLWGLLLVFVTQLISALFSVDDSELYDFLPYDNPAGGALFSVVLTIFGTWVLLLIAKALGGRGTYASLISALGFAQIPTIFYAPLAVVSSWIGSWFLGLGSLAISVWLLVLGVIAIRDMLQMTTGRAIGALLLSGLALIVIVFVVTMVAVFSNLGSLGIV